MAAKPRITSAPSPETREHLWQVIRSSPQPLTASALARLLTPPHKIAAAAIGPILDQEVAAGRLYKLPPATTRGAPRYWDRDPTTLIRSTTTEAVRQSDKPQTARELLRVLGLPFKITEPELVQILNEHVAAGAVHSIPPATAKSKLRYWLHDALEFGRQEIVRLLEAKGAQNQASLKKAIKGFSDSQFQQIVQSAIEDRVLWRHPPLGKSKHELFGNSPLSPEPYLRNVGGQLAKIIAQLHGAHVPREQLRRSIVQLLEAAGIEFTASRELDRTGNSQRSSQSVDIVSLMRRLESGADRGALVGARDLRRAAQVDKPAFDQAVLDLARQGRLSLHRHDYAASLTPAERDDLVTDGAGTYYIGMALRSGAGPAGSAAP